MNEDIIIRRETEQDYRAVEELTREAFWNVYKPGADEHYYVHMMRSHPDFIPELDFVLEQDGRIIGNIMYTKAWLEDENGQRKEIVSCGPLCVHPDFQRKKLGKLLIEHSFAVARDMGYDVNVNFGNPGNYVTRGSSAARRRTSAPSGGGIFPRRCWWRSWSRALLTAGPGCTSPAPPPTAARTRRQWRSSTPPSPPSRKPGPPARRSSTSTATRRW